MIFGSNQKLLMARAGAVPVDRSWNLNYAVYSGTSLSVSAKDTEPRGIFFKSDGLELYFAGNSSDSVHQYTMTSAWDISSASFTATKSVSAQDSSPMDVFFKDDGLVMYVLGDQGNDVSQYALSSAWDISTASFTQSFSVGSQDTVPRGLFFKSDGLVMYVLGDQGDDLNQYALSTAWDISTASFTQSFSTNIGNNTNGIFFKPDGNSFYITTVAALGTGVKQFNLSSSWDISTATLFTSIDVDSVDFGRAGIFFKDDGSKMFLSGYSGDAIYDFDVG